MPETVLRRSESSFEGGGGLTLFRRAWLPAKPRRVMIVTHGFAEHSGRYDHFGAWFAERGTAVHAYDQRGHGHSPGTRGHVERFDDLLDDLDRLRAVVESEHPGLPVVLVGHSMGGLVLTCYLRKRQPSVAAAVSSGAALHLEGSLPSWQIFAARVLRRVAPRLALSANLPLEGLASDPEVARRYQADPLVFEKLTVSLAVELVDAANHNAASEAKVAVPMLVLHGADDSICTPEGSRILHAGLDAPDSELRVYSGLRHEIFNEPSAEHIFTEIDDWLRMQGIA